MGAELIINRMAVADDASFHLSSVIDRKAEGNKSMSIFDGDWNFLMIKY